MRGCGWGDFVTRTVISLVVTPAKAGVQGLNNKAAQWAAFHCVACGDSYLWVADPRQVTFLCLSKEKSPKEKTPRSRRLPLALLAGIGARLTRRALNNAPRAQTRPRLNAPGGTAVLCARYGVEKTSILHCRLY